MLLSKFVVAKENVQCDLKPTNQPKILATKWTMVSICVRMKSRPKRVEAHLKENHLPRISRNGAVHVDVRDVLEPEAEIYKLNVSLT